MCGIAGHLAFPRADPQAVARMSARLAHRGPDGAGALDEGCLALGHRRLSIIDLAGGAQPIWNEERTVAVVLNGEIYNHRALRAELAARHAFRTRSDTEVLVHLWEEEGEAMLPRLRGMFAFALWDARARRLVLARDAFGEKPLYWAEGPFGLAFASELPALRAGGFPLGGLDRAALADYLALLYVPAPRTILAGAHKLPAGHLLVADERGALVRRWYAPPAPGSGGPPDPAALSATLAEAVGLRLESDVPVAALLSGGLDSSAVVALLAQATGPGLRTFSVGFGAADDELPFARLVAERYRTQHTELVVAPDALAQTEEAFAACGEPFGDSSVVPTVAVCKAVAREVKVVLTGDGGDEFFAGYGRVRLAGQLPSSRALGALVGALTRLPLPRASTLERAGRTVAARGLARAVALLEVFSPRERAALLGPKAPEPGHAQLVRELEARLPGASDADCALAFDLGVYLPEDLLMKADLSSMHSSLEARAPLLDAPLAALAVPAPAAAKLAAPEGKAHLREAVRALLPAPILARRKRGFGAPVAAWLAGPLAPLLRERVLAPSARLKQHLEPRAVDRVARQALAGRGNPHQAWALLALESWLLRPEAA